MTTPHLYLSETCKIVKTEEIDASHFSMFSKTGQFVTEACEAAGKDPEKASPVEIRDAVYRELRLKPCFEPRDKMRVAAAAVKSMINRGQFSALSESPKKLIRGVFQAPDWFPAAFSTIIWL